MSKKPNISCLIVNYESADVLEQCVMALRHIADPAQCEILIANNDAQPLAFHSDQHVRIIQNDSNLGFGAAQNALAQRACADVLLILNPDTYGFQANFLTLSQYLSEDVGIVAPYILTPEGNVQAWSYGDDVTPGSIMRNNTLGQKTLARSTDIQSVQWVTGAAFMIKKSLFQAIGGFDTAFFLYFEDIDLCKRVRQAGCAVHIIPGYTVSHHLGSSSHDTGIQKKHYYAAQDHYLQKYYNPLIVKVLRFVRSITHHA